jgi:TolB-like protein/Tfp pilus assembly protein PilF
MSLYAELKRRNVIRVAIAYAVAAWLLIEVSATTFPMLMLPEWTATFVTVLLMIGFPVALIFAWAYELTPEGIKKERDVDSTQSITNITGRKLDYLIITVLVVALGYFVYDKFVLGALQIEAITQTATEQTTASPLESIASDYSIAVLPFVNMSSDPNNEYFADGLSEELLNVLARIKSLRVTGRTSSFHFKGSSPDLREVGKVLGVAHILEGSVRKQGNQVRVTAQLIHASDGFHMWSDTYDFQLDDIFAVQDRIAAEVAEALQQTLLGDVRVVEITVTERATPNIDAATYSLYLQALARFGPRTLEGHEAAIELLQQVIEAAPEFAEGWAALSDVTLLLHHNHRTISWEDAKATAATAVANALALAPDTSVVQTAWAHYNWDLLTKDGYQPAREVLIRAFERAIELDPQNPEALYWFGSFWMENSEREHERALILFERALAVDPLRIIARQWRIDTLHALGRLDEAKTYALESIRIFPQKAYLYTLLAKMEESRGRLDRAWLWLEQADPNDRGWMDQEDRFYLAKALDYEAGMRNAAVQGSVNPYSQPVYEAFLQIRDGEVVTAIATLEAAAVKLGLKNFNLALGRLKAIMGDCAGALEIHGRVYGDDLYDDPEGTLDRLGVWTASHVAFCLSVIGRTDQAKAVAEAIVAKTDWVDEAPRFSGKAPYFQLSRIAALCVLEEEARALQRLEAYIAGGQRSLWKYSWLEIDQDSRFQTLHNNPRFIKLIKEVRADNARMLEAVLSGEVTLEDAP